MYNNVSWKYSFKLVVEAVLIICLSLFLSDQFLKEARNHDYKGNVEVESSNSNKAGNAKQSSGGLKNKKSWKRSLFSWLKAEKKSNKPNMESSNSSYTIPKPPQRGYVSGPIHGGGGGISSRPRRPNSGPLTGLFNSAKRTEEEQIPYVCLDKLNNNPPGFDCYGPVYLVT